MNKHFYKLWSLCKSKIAWGVSGPTRAVFRREMLSYFTTPIAYLFICIFLVLSGVLTFYGGHFFERHQADLQPFFMFHPWLYLFFIPALSMRLWAEERKTGSMELLLTLPITTVQAVTGKFLAAWSFTALTLLLTFPFWIAVSILGDPDHGVIFTSYLASLLIAGGYLAMSLAVSSLTRSQVIAYCLAVFVCFAFTFTGLGFVLQLMDAAVPVFVVEILRNLSVLSHFDTLSLGIVALPDLLYFAALIVGFLLLNVLYVEAGKQK